MENTENLIGEGRGGSCRWNSELAGYVNGVHDAKEEVKDLTESEIGLVELGRGGLTSADKLGNAKFSGKKHRMKNLYLGRQTETAWKKP